MAMIRDRSLIISNVKLEVRIISELQVKLP